MEKERTTLRPVELYEANDMFCIEESWFVSVKKAIIMPNSFSLQIVSGNENYMSVPLYIGLDGNFIGICTQYQCI